MLIKHLQKIVILSVILGMSISCDKFVDYEPNSEPVIHKYPQNLYVNVGDTIDSHCFSIEATDPDNDVLKYQWYEDLGDDSETGGRYILGATSSTFIPDKSVIDTVSYFVSVTDDKIDISTGAFLIVLDANVDIDSIYNTLDTNNILAN